MFRSARDFIEEAFAFSASDLIQSYTGVTPHIKREEIPDVTAPIAAVIGFGDSKFCASAILLASESAVIALSESVPHNPVDWLGELANQLVGRLKNKLSQYGVLPSVGAPVTVFGSDFDLGSVGTTPVAWRVSWPGGECYVLLGIKIENDLELVFDPCSIPAEEGSVEMF
jgi:hypothetical protein